MEVVGGKSDVTLKVYLISTIGTPVLCRKVNYARFVKITQEKNWGQFMKKRIQPHIMCGIGDVGKYILLSGDPERVERAASFFDEARKVAEHRGFVTYTGKVGGVELSACSTGIGCPSAAIVVEELARIGGDTFIRVGTTGAIKPEIEIGDLIIPTAAVRGDGVTRAYFPVEYPAVADLNVTLSLVQAVKEIRRPYHLGTILTSDAFYGEDSETMRHLMEMNVLSVEMECSVIFALARMRKLRAGAILVVDGNLMKGTGKGEFEPGEKTGELDERVQETIEDAIRAGIKAVKILEEEPLAATS